MANYSSTVQRSYVFENVKTARAYEKLSKLPFVNSSTDSALYNLLNIPNIELDRIRDRVRDSSIGTNPATTNFSLPTNMFLTKVSVNNFTEAGLVTKEVLHHGPPTSFEETEAIDINDLADELLDIHYLSPAFYLDEDYNVIPLKEAYAALTRASNSWFDQKVKLYSIDFSEVYHSEDLPYHTQDIYSDSDEWVTLDSDGTYTLANSTIDASSVKLIDVRQSTSDTVYIPISINTDGTASTIYTITGNVLEIIDEAYKNLEIVIEYNYAPADYLKSFTYSEDFFSVLKNSRNNRNFLYLPSLETTRYINYLIVNNRLLFEQHELQIGGLCSGSIVINKTKSDPDAVYSGIGDDQWGVTLVVPSDFTLNTLTSFIIGDIEIIDNTSWRIEEIQNSSNTIKAYKSNKHDLVMKNGSTISLTEAVSVSASYNKTVQVTYMPATDPEDEDDPMEYIHEGLSYEYSEIVVDETAQEIDEFIYVSADLTTVSASHHSLSYYPYTIHFEDDDFGRAFISLNYSEAGSYLEKYSMDGQVQARVALSLNSIAIKRFETEVAVLVDNSNDFQIDYYKIDDFSFARTIYLTEGNIPTDYYDICLTLLKDHSFELVFLIEGDQLRKVRYTPEYDYKAEAPFLDLLNYGYALDAGTKYYYYRKPPESSEYFDQSLETLLEPDKAIVEHPLDQWGRILGNDRWNEESLIQFSDRLTGVSVAKGNTNLQKALDGISAGFGIESYNQTKHNQYTLAYPLARVKEDLESEVKSATQHNFNCPTLLRSEEDIVSVHINSVDYTSLFVDNVTLADQDVPNALSYSQLTIDPIVLTSAVDETASFTIKIEYKPLSKYTRSNPAVEYQIGGNTSSTIMEDEVVSSNALINFVADTDLPDNEEEVTVEYYTRASAADVFLQSTSLVGDYYLVSETITIINNVDPADQITLVSILDETTSSKKVPAEYENGLSLATADFNFKWGDGTIGSLDHAFQWDTYRWADGENIKTGIPTLFFENGMTSTTDADFISGTSGSSLSLKNNKVIDNKIKLETGYFYYENRECFLYPEATTRHTDITADITTLNGIPSGASPTSLRNPVDSTWILNTDGSQFGTSAPETIRSLNDSSLISEQYSYINSNARIIRPMVKFPENVGIPDIANLLDSPMDTSDNYYYIENQTSTLPKLFISYSDADGIQDGFTLIYGTKFSDELEVPIDIAPDLDVDKKILCIGNTNLGMDSVTIFSTNQFFTSDDSEIILLVAVTDTERCYMENIEITAASTNTNVGLSDSPTLTNTTGLAPIKVDISNVAQSLNIYITAAQTGGNPESVTASITLTKID